MADGECDSSSAGGWDDDATSHEASPSREALAEDFRTSQRATPPRGMRLLWQETVHHTVARQNSVPSIRHPQGADAWQAGEDLRLSASSQTGSQPHSLRTEPEPEAPLHPGAETEDGSEATDLGASIDSLAQRASAALRRYPGAAAPPQDSALGAIRRHTWGIVRSTSQEALGPAVPAVPAYVSVAPALGSVAYRSTAPGQTGTAVMVRELGHRVVVPVQVAR